MDEVQPQPRPLINDVKGLASYLSANKGPFLLTLVQIGLLWVLNKIDMVVVVIMLVSVPIFREVYKAIFGE